MSVRVRVKQKRKLPMSLKARCSERQLSGIDQVRTTSRDYKRRWPLQQKQWRGILEDYAALLHEAQLLLVMPFEVAVKERVHDLDAHNFAEVLVEKGRVVIGIADSDKLSNDSHEANKTRTHDPFAWQSVSLRHNAQKETETTNIHMNSDKGHI